MRYLQAALFLLGSSCLALGTWHLSVSSPTHVRSEPVHAQSDIVAALDQEAALTTGKIWAEGLEDQQQQ